MRKIIEAFFSLSPESKLTELLKDYGEIGLDSLSNDGIIKQIPI